MLARERMCGRRLSSAALTSDDSGRVTCRDACVRISSVGDCSRQAVESREYHQVIRPPKPAFEPSCIPCLESGSSTSCELKVDGLELSELSGWRSSVSCLACLVGRLPATCASSHHLLSRARRLRYYLGTASPYLLGSRYLSRCVIARAARGHKEALICAATARWHQVLSSYLCTCT